MLLNAFSLSIGLKLFSSIFNYLLHNSFFKCLLKISLWTILKVKNKIHGSFPPAAKQADNSSALDTTELRGRKKKRKKKVRLCLPAPWLVYDLDCVHFSPVPEINQEPAYRLCELINVHIPPHCTSQPDSNCGNQFNQRCLWSHYNLAESRRGLHPSIGLRVITV